MQQEAIILLPGMNEQSNAFLRHHKIKETKMLVMGTAAPHLLKKFLNPFVASIDVIIDNEDLLLTERLSAPKDKKVRIRFMDFVNTDFTDNTFDFVYTQGAASTLQRVKVLHEVKRILKPGGVYCLGELVYIKGDVPVSIRSVWDIAGISPIELEQTEGCYTEAGFTILETTDLSKTLYAMYERYKEVMQNGASKMTEDELQALRHDLIRLKHEAEIFIKMGGDKYTGYFMYELQKPL
ncbi:MAG: class I SAM-dependent methyltransferase [Ignavibacteriales bacterium]|nr:class I SAM-dependent methyltransferase [Ignavibacteriales bacterium]